MLKSILKSSTGKSLIVPFILISCLYLLWGCAHGLLDVLNKHFQGIFEMTKAQSGFIQFSTYIAYFIMAIPAGLIMNKVGYKRGIIFGLMLFALGSFSFIPAAFVHSPVPFLCALFVIACGLCIIETGAHPYATSLGPEEYAAQRINIAAAFNGVGWIVGPLVGGILIFGADPTDHMALAKPYILVGSAVMIIAISFAFTKLVEVSGKPVDDSGIQTNKSIWSHRNLLPAIIAQFLYCGAQTGIFSFFINYVTELDPTITNLNAAKFLAFGGMGLFLIGRLSSSFIMSLIRPNKLLALYSALASVSMILVIFSIGKASLYALYASFFFMSMMFPTIFALGVKGVGEHTKKASSYIVMGVVGGAVFPLLMGYIGESNMALGFILPLLSFVFILFFGLKIEKRH